MIGYYVHHQGRGHLHRALAIAAHAGTDDHRSVQPSAPGRVVRRLAASWPTTPAPSPRREHDGRRPAALRAVRRTTGCGADGRAVGLDRRHPPGRDGGRRVGGGGPAGPAARRPGAHPGPARPARDPAAHPGLRRSASRSSAPWPATAGQIWQADPTAVAGKVTHLGAISRFPVLAEPADADPGQRCWCSTAPAAGRWPRGRTRPEAATPDWDWAHLGGSGRHLDGRPVAGAAHGAVVVSHCGQNAVADIAAARRPAILIPQPRPFGEQAAMAAAVAPGRRARDRARRLAGSRPQWPALLSRAEALDGAGWSLWNDGGGPARAAADAWQAGRQPSRSCRRENGADHRRSTVGTVISGPAGGDRPARPGRPMCASWSPWTTRTLAEHRRRQATVVTGARRPARAAAGRRPQRRRGRGAGRRRRAAGLPRRRLPARPRAARPLRGRGAGRGPPALLCGPVAYLPPPPPGGYDPNRLVGPSLPCRPARPAAGRPGQPAATTGCSGRCPSRSPADGWVRVGGFCSRLRRLRRRGHRLRPAGPARRAGPDLGRRRRRVPPVASRRVPAAARTWPTSCATARCSPSAGAGGRWAVGWTSWPPWAWPGATPDGGWSRDRTGA